MARVNVFLKDELLNDINVEAEAEGTNRSALIQAALESYIQQKRLERQEEERRKAMQEASLKMDALAKKLGKWDARGTIRKSRNANLKAGS